MYEYIKGNITEITTTYVVLENNGIGYIINISLECYNIIENNKEQKLYIYNVIREDSSTFFGFIDKEERELFKLLISVSGIGSNTARVLLSSYPYKELINIIDKGDFKSLERIKGIGTKSAQRIIIDLRDKISLFSKFSNEDLDVITKNYKDKQEAILALESLGFIRKNIEKIVEEIMSLENDISVENIVRKSLKKLSN